MYRIYYRVSTKQQGDSGLGLEAQKTIVNHYIDAEQVTEVYTEVASAKSVHRRPILQQAIQDCLQAGEMLVVAKLDRLSRKTEDALAVYSQLKGKLMCCDIPNLDKFTLTLFMAIADRERELISLRTKAALAERKKVTGEWRKPGEGFADGGRLAQAVATNQEKAERNPNNRRAASLICSLHEAGKSWREIVNKLNESGFQAPRGGSFSSIQVRRIYRNLC